MDMKLVEDVHEYGVKQHTPSVSMLYVSMFRRDELEHQSPGLVS